MFHERTPLIIVCLCSATLAQFYDAGVYPEMDFPSSYFTDDIDPFERDFEDDINSFDEDEDDKSGWMTVSEGADLVSEIEAAEEQDRRTTPASLTTNAHEIESYPTEKPSEEEENEVSKTTPLWTVANMISSLWTTIPSMGMETEKSSQTAGIETSEEAKISRETQRTNEETKEPMQEIQKTEEVLKVVVTESSTIETRTGASRGYKSTLEPETESPLTDEVTHETNADILKLEEGEGVRSGIKTDAIEGAKGRKETEARKSEEEASSKLEASIPEATNGDQESKRKKSTESEVKLKDTLEESEVQAMNSEAEDQELEREKSTESEVKLTYVLETGAPKTNEGTQEANTESSKPEEEKGNSEIKTEAMEATEGGKETEAPQPEEVSSKLEIGIPEATEEGQESEREKSTEYKTKLTDTLGGSEVQAMSSEAEATKSSHEEKILTASADELDIPSTEF
ncbi:hypothetical protein Aperf_G00000076309 [Anoplocephala perfoliata]